jgi:APA family basic amino acid/polyamine antiporter
VTGGAGIYALVGEVAGETGGAIWRGFAAAGVLAFFTAASYAELVTKYPQAAGAALYVHRAWRTPFFTFLVAFAVVCSGVTSAATLATAFGGDYLEEFVDLPQVLVGIVFIGVIALVNFRGIKESVTLNMGLTAIELTGLLLVVLIGVVFLLDGGGDPGRAFEFKAGDAVPFAILGGASLAFLRALRLRGLRQRRGGVPRADARVSRGAVHRPAHRRRRLHAGDDRRLDGGGDEQARGLGRAVARGRSGRSLAMNTKVFSAIALFALTNGALINLIMASRLIYGMAQQGIVPRPLGRVHRERRTPWVAIIFTTALAMVLVVIGDLTTLANTTVLLLLAVFVCVNIAVLVLRGQPVEHRHFHAPTLLPILGVGCCIALIIDKLADDATTFA